jgi:hypothetical protein
MNRGMFIVSCSTKETGGIVCVHVDSVMHIADGASSQKLNTLTVPAAVTNSAADSLIPDHRAYMSVGGTVICVLNQTTFFDQISSI